MSALFTINFRREAYLLEVSRRRRRLIALGVWVGYFGALMVLVGLYGLNGASLARRAFLIERQTMLIRHARDPALGSQLSAAELGQVEAAALSTRQWRDRLGRLGNLLPQEARLMGLTANPQNMSDDASKNALSLSGELHSAAGQDRMQGVMKIVSALGADSVFKGSYHDIRLASTRISENGVVQFEIDCR